MSPDHVSLHGPQRESQMPKRNAENQSVENSVERPKSLSVESFRQQLRKEVMAVCQTLGKNYDKEQDRGFAFEIWVAELLQKIESIDADPEDSVFQTNDLKIDIAFEDEDSKLLALAQTKFVSIAANPDVPEHEVHDFFKRHELLSAHDDWVFEHASEELYDLISDYRERLKTGWKIGYTFISTGTASDRVKGLVETLNKAIKEVQENVTLELCDFYGRKDLYIRSQAIEASISEYVDIQFAENATIKKEVPHRTLVSVVKGNTLVGLYRKEKDSLFAHNIRSFMGKRANKEIVETAKSKPSEFYYFNNGVSGICTEIEDRGKNIFRFHNFQIINGAQTVGSLSAVRDLSSECEVLLRITEGASVKTEKGFNADIIRFNNRAPRTMFDFDA
jgi:AIPR protein